MTERRDYTDLTREELEARLTRAEDVCVLVGWTALGDQADDREAALTELWMRWSHATPGAGDRRANPHLSDEAIHELAEARRAIRQATLRRIAYGITS